MNFGFSESFRRAFLNKNSFEGVVYVDVYGTKQITRKFVCKNVLYTTAPYVKCDDKVNTDLPDGTYAAPEAYTTLSGISELLPNSGDPVYGNARPFFNYRLGDVEGDTYVIYGPAPEDSFTPAFKVRADGKEYVVGLRGGIVGVNDLDLPCRELTEETALAFDRCYLVDEESGLSRLFEFKQKSLMIDGVAVRCDSVLQVLKILAYFEWARTSVKDFVNPFLDDSASIYLPIKKTRVGWILGDKAKTYYEANCVGNEFIHSLFQRMSADEDNIYIRDHSGAIGTLQSTEPNVSCFVFCLINLLALAGDSSITALMTALNAAIKAKLIVRTTGTRLEGRTSKIIDFGSYVWR